MKYFMELIPFARCLKHFPGLADEALDALFDLCEDEDVNVSKISN